VVAGSSFLVALVFTTILLVIPPVIVSAAVDAATPAADTPPGTCRSSLTVRAML